jgi:hypothetical protein
MNYLQPGVRIWGIQLELGRELIQQSWSGYVKGISYRNADLCKKKDLNSCASTIPPRARNAVFVCHGTRLELQSTHDVNLPKVVCVESTGKLTSVAAHVQADTIPDAISPGLTLRDALLNSSELLGEYAVYRAWIAVRHIIKALKNRPMPEQIVDFQSPGKRSKATDVPTTDSPRYTIDKFSTAGTKLKTHRRRIQHPEVGLADWQKT